LITLDGHHAQCGHKLHRNRHKISSKGSGSSSSSSRAAHTMYNVPATCTISTLQLHSSQRNIGPMQVGRWGNTAQRLALLHHSLFSSRMPILAVHAPCNQHNVHQPTVRIAFKAMLSDTSRGAGGLWCLVP
jgi:hypothetical protein